MEDEWAEVASHGEQSSSGRVQSVPTTQCGSATPGNDGSRSCSGDGSGPHAQHQPAVEVAYSGGSGGHEAQAGQGQDNGLQQAPDQQLAPKQSEISAVTDEQPAPDDGTGSGGGLGATDAGAWTGGWGGFNALGSTLRAVAAGETRARADAFHSCGGSCAASCRGHDSSAPCAACRMPAQARCGTCES